jgi:hypothetical protein
MESDKFEVIDWLGRQIQSGESVASSDLEDSYIVPFYTNGSAFVPVFGLTPMPPLESAKRYFYTLSLLQNGEAYFDAILGMAPAAIEAHFRFLVGGVKAPYDYGEFQKVAFYEAILYYPYNQLYKDVLNGENEQTMFSSRMRELKTAAEKQAYRFSYFIIRSDQSLQNSSAFTEVFRNKSYVVFKRTTGS